MDDDIDMNAGKEELEDRIDAYLSGRLGIEETRRFEREMQRSDVAELVWQELALRDLLQHAPPDDAHATLYELIEGELDVALGQARQRERKGRSLGEQGQRILGRVGMALLGAGWAIRGPAAAFQGSTQGSAGTSGQLEGLATMRHALGPLSEGLPEGSSRAVGTVTGKAVGAVTSKAVDAVRRRGAGKKRKRGKKNVLGRLVRRVLGGKRG